MTTRIGPHPVATLHTRAPPSTHQGRAVEHFRHIRDAGGVPPPDVEVPSVGRPLEHVAERGRARRVPPRQRLRERAPHEPREDKREVCHQVDTPVMIQYVMMQL